MKSRAVNLVNLDRCTLERVTVVMGGAIVLDVDGPYLATIAAVQGGLGLDGNLSFVCDLGNSTLRVDVRPVRRTLWSRLRAAAERFQVQP
jgi:hypothetical protein